MQDYHEFLDEILIDEATLQVRITELAEEINRDYQGETLHLICILRGGVIFLTDLMRHLTVLNSVDFMAISSYGTSRQTTGQVRINMDLVENISGRNVLLVEDIVDSGYTIASVLAISLSKHFDVRLIFCFEKQGVLTDVNQEDSVIRNLNHTLYKDLLAKGSFHDGILPKLENAFNAIQSGVKEVLIGEHTSLLANTGYDTKGTLITQS